MIDAGGADRFGDLTMPVAGRLTMELVSTVLWLRGRALVGQPYKGPDVDKADVLCWNGDVFGGLDGEEKQIVNIWEEK